MKKILTLLALLSVNLVHAESSSYENKNSSNITGELNDKKKIIEALKDSLRFSTFKCEDGKKVSKNSILNNHFRKYDIVVDGDQITLSYYYDYNQVKKDNPTLGLDHIDLDYILNISYTFLLSHDLKSVNKIMYSYSLSGPTTNNVGTIVEPIYRKEHSTGTNEWTCDIVYSGSN